MKVEALKDKYNQIRIAVKKNKETINISFSFLAEDTVALETDYLNIDSLELDNFFLVRSGLTVTYAKNRNKITKVMDKEESNSIDYGHRISICRPNKVNFRLNLVIYYVTNGKRKK